MVHTSEISPHSSARFDRTGLKLAAFSAQFNAAFNARSGNKPFPTYTNLNPIGILLRALQDLDRFMRLRMARYALPASMDTAGDVWSVRHFVPSSITYHLAQIFRQLAGPKHAIRFIRPHAEGRFQAAALFHPARLLAELGQRGR